MQNKKQLTTEELRERFLFLSGGDTKKNLNESVVTSNSTSKLLKYERMADGKVYGIVQEGQKFYIKVCSAPSTNVLNVSDFVYLGGSMDNERLYEKYDSYNKVLTRFHGKKVALNETFGRLNESDDKDEFEPIDEEFELNGKKYNSKSFDSEDEVNNFLEKNDEYGVIGKKGDKIFVAKKSDKGEVNEEIPLNKDVDAKKGETIVPAPAETTPAPVETPVSEPTTPVEAPAAPVSADVTSEPEAVDNTDIADYNPENSTTPAPAPSADSAPEASTDVPATDTVDAPVDSESNTEGSDDTVSEIQSLLGKLGAEFRKLPEVDATTAKSAINNIISSTKSGIEKLDDKDKEEIKKRIDKNGEKIDESENIDEAYGDEKTGAYKYKGYTVKVVDVNGKREVSIADGKSSPITVNKENKPFKDSSEANDYINKNLDSLDEEVESTDDELDAETINEITELCGIDSKEVEEKLNEAIKTPYGKYLVKKLIKEEMSRYQSDDIVAENDDKKEVEGGYYRFNPSTKTFQTTMINKENEPYPGEEFDKEDDAINHLKNSVTEPVQESKYQKYLAAKKNKLVKEDDVVNNPTPDIQKQFDDEENEGLPAEIVDLYNKGVNLVRTYKNSKKEHYYPMIIEIVRKLRDAGHSDKAKKLLQMANQAIPRA
jgi:hypothetical protein